MLVEAGSEETGTSVGASTVVLLDGSGKEMVGKIEDSGIEDGG